MYTPSNIAFSTASLGYPVAVTVTNLAVNGQTLATNYTRALAGALDPYYTETGPSAFFIEGGTNDLGSNTTASALYTIATNLVDLAKRKGFYVIIQTVMKRRNFTQESERIAYNNLVAANSAGADYVLDLRNDPYFGDASTYSDSGDNRTVDGLHASAASQDAWALLIKAKTDLVLARAIRWTAQADLTVGARQVVTGTPFATPIVGGTRLGRPRQHRVTGLS